MTSIRNTQSHRLVGAAWLCLACACATAQATRTPDAPGGAQQPPRSSATGRFQNAVNELRRTLGVDPDPIIIGIDKGNLTYIPSEFRVPAGQEVRVRWVSFDGPFRLTFSPFDAAQFESKFASDSGVHQFETTIPKTAAKGKYHYKVKLRSTAEGKDYEDPDCPPIIIE